MSAKYGVEGVVGVVVASGALPRLAVGAYVERPRGAGFGHLLLELVEELKQKEKINGRKKRK